MWRWFETVVSAAALASIASCTTVVNEPIADPATKLDEEVFRCNVQPILARQCSYNACHGNAETALRVYTPGKLRATTPTNADEATAALTDAEQHANFTSAAGFSLAVSSPEENWLLLKPLPATDGGFEHKGGAIWRSGSNDPQAVVIYQWLLGASSCN